MLLLSGWQARPANPMARELAESFPQDDDAFWPFVRQLFPLTHDRIYFNAGGLGPSPYPVLEAMDAMRQKLEAICETGHHYHEPVRRKVASFLGADPDEIAFTRNATEGMNIIARGLNLRPGDEIVTTTHEHPGGAMPWLALAQQRGLKIRLFEPDNDPDIFLANLKKAVRSKTRVLMFSHVTCTLGTVFQAKELCQWARQRSIISVIDGAQAVGQIPVNLHAIGCDFYTTSGHKWLLGPKESGILYISKNAQTVFRPSFVGAYSDRRYDLDRLKLELRQEAVANEYGTRDAAKIQGIGAAVAFIQSIGAKRYYARIRQLGQRLKSALAEVSDLDLLTPMDPDRSAGIVTFRIRDKDYREVSRQLMKQYKMRVRNVGEHGIHATRVSLHIYNSEKEVDLLIQAIETIVKG